MIANIRTKAPSWIIGAFGVVVLLVGSADARTLEGKCHKSKSTAANVFYARCTKCESRGLPDYANGQFDTTSCVEKGRQACIAAMGSVNARYPAPAPNGCSVQGDEAALCNLIRAQCEAIVEEWVVH